MDYLIFAFIFDILISERLKLLEYDERTYVPTSPPHTVTNPYHVDRSKYTQSLATKSYDVKGIGRTYCQWLILSLKTKFRFECPLPHSDEEINAEILFGERKRNMENCIILALPARADGTIVHVTIFRRQFIEGFMFPTKTKREDLLGLFHLTVYASLENG